jgi:hypothetical protein
LFWKSREKPSFGGPVSPAGGEVMGWAEAYLPDVDRQRLDDWLATCDVPREAGGWLLERAADCRLAFARLVAESSDGLPPSALVSVPESIISQTQISPTSGRPATTRWALWAAYIVRDSELSSQARFRSRQLAELVQILTGRRMTAAELRGEFGRLRNEANDHASRAAIALLSRPVRAELKAEEFAAYFRQWLSKDLDSNTQMPPMIVDGRLNEEWLERVVRVRRAVLRDVNKLGVLTGEPPLIRLLPVSQLYRGLPLGPPPSRTVHLGKSLDVQSPTISAPTSISVSLNLSTPPYRAALSALPRWWSEWEAALHLPMHWRAT